MEASVAARAPGRANELRSLHVTYDFVQGHPADAFDDFELELAYQAPDRGYLRFEGSSDLFESWCTGERILVHTRGGGEGERWRVQAVPPALRSAAGSGMVVCLVWPGLDGERFAAWLDFRAARTAPFDWLRRLQDAGVSARRDGARIYWSGRDSRGWLTSSIGLLERLEFRRRDGFQFRLELDESALDEPLPARLLEPPPAASRAEPFGE